MATSDSPQVGIYTDPPKTGSRNATMHFEASNTLDMAGTLALSGTIQAQGGTLDMTSGTFVPPGAQARGYIGLGTHLFTARNAASGETVASGSTTPTAFYGGMLMPDGQPSLGFNTTVGRIPALSWASANVAAIVLPPIAMPADLSTAGGLTFELFGEIVGTASAADAVDAITVAAHFAALTSASDANVGTTHPSFTSTPSWKGITIASGSLSTNSLSVILTPQAHAAQILRVYNARMSYQRKTTSST